MAVQVPTPDQIEDVADEIGLNVTEADVASYIELMRGTVEAYNVVDAMPDNLPQVSYARTPGYRPGAAENKYNAWHVKTTVNGAARGKLGGKTIVLKDNIMLAGVPMMNGAATLQGYIPEIDATVVTRILDAGGTIVGKAHCESFCLSGGSHTNATGPVHNPHKMGYSAGGSSSGSAALVAAKEVDMAMGGDQGGSIRMPASYCGVYGMKATHGLVPYTGIMPIEIYVDHTGPMTNTVEDNALLLEVIAGEDGYDPRQYNVKTQRYTKALQGAKGIKGMKIAVVKEGYQAENAEKDVNTKVRAAAKKLQTMGAKVKEVSIPMHPLGGALWMPIGIEGLTQTMMHGDGYGLSRPDLYVTS
ncbi:MAG: amidase, partial [Alphaproteobacteria bacterium]|nr:amidase [Alphaproteobacteria bacterium]